MTALYNADYTREFFQRAPWLAGLSDSSPSPEAPAEMATRLIVGLAAMSVGYLLAIIVANGSSTGLVVGFAALFRVTLALLPGLFSTDVFSYVMYGRIAAAHGENPYASPPSAFPTDPFLDWVFPFWRDQASVYGPLWTDASALWSHVSATWTPFDQVLLYRASLVAFEAIALAALWWVLGRLAPRERTRAWLIYAWNPVVLFDLVGASHNDAAMLALMLVGIGLMAPATVTATGPSLSDPAASLAREDAPVPTSVREPPAWRWVLGIGALALAALVKYAAAILVLVGVVAWSAHASTTRVRAQRLAIGFGVPLALAAVFWGPWLGASGALQPLGETAGGRLMLNSAPDLVALTLADQVLVPRGMPADPSHEIARAWMRWVTRVLVVGYLGWELGRLWRRTTSAADFGEVHAAALGVSARLLLVLPLAVLTWVWSWYFTWSLAIVVALGARSMMTRLAVAYTLVALPVVYAHQYLNEQLPGIWVLVMALGPLVVLIPYGSQRPTAQPQPVPAGER
ncbi:MAG TPA: hypothetical protein VGJ60_05135 [Chloroflexota bacterium]|jgi:hypothetical protein